MANTEVAPPGSTTDVAIEGSVAAAVGGNRRRLRFAGHGSSVFRFPPPLAVWLIGTVIIRAGSLALH